MRRLLLGLLLMLAGFAALAQNPQPAAAPNLAGKVELVEGDVSIYDKARKPRRVAVGDPVYEGEGIVTGKDGELHIDMEDGGFIAVRPNTKMSIAAYRAEGGDRDQGIFSLLQGTFRSVTGWIAKFNPRSYQVRTPTATIGVRGTDHEPLVVPQGSTEGEPGSYDKVNVGGTYIQARHGRVDVRPNQAGFVPLKGRLVPRLLPQVPAIFKATRHEAAIAARHEAVRKVIDQRRDERRKALQERRGPGQEIRQKRENADRPRQGFDDRRQRDDGRREEFRRERDGRGRDLDRPQRSPDREQGARGGGRGRD